jgi:hypothetical protein
MSSTRQRVICQEHISSTTADSSHLSGNCLSQRTLVQIECDYPSLFLLPQLTSDRHENPKMAYREY